MTHDDLIVLTSWLASQGHSAEDIAYAVEKPWKYEAELAAAKHEQDTGHQTTTGSTDGHTFCMTCRWSTDPDAEPFDMSGSTPGAER